MRSRALYRNGDTVVMDEVIDGQRIRSLYVGGTWQSAVYLNPLKRNAPVFEYFKVMDAILRWKDPFQSGLMIGGGMYTFPRILVNRNQDLHMDVCEINPDFEKLAMRYFLLGEAKDNITTYLMDGREYLEQTKKSYDVIIHDAFEGRNLVRSLITLEGIQAVKRHLKKDGVYLINHHGYKMLDSSGDLLVTAATLRRCFEHVRLFQAAPENYEVIRCNWVVLAGDGDLDVFGNIPDAPDLNQIRYD